MINPFFQPIKIKYKNNPITLLGRKFTYFCYKWAVIICFKKHFARKMGLNH